MSDLKKIKQFILEKEKIDFVLEELGCSHIELRNNRYEAQLPDKFNSNNRRSVQIRVNDNLSAHIRSRGMTGDIYSLVSYIKHDCKTEDEMQNDLYRAKEWLVDILDCHHLLSKDKKKRADLLHWLKPIKKKRTRVVDLAEITPNDVLDEEETYKYYDMYPAQWWIDEGLSWETQCEFEVGFDILSERIVFAIRDARGELVGVKGRTVVNDTRKYLYLYPCNKSIELFNLYRATPIIKDIKRVIIFESEKSVMFAHQYGYGECIAICGDELSDVQAQLIKNLGHDIQIIFAMDKDKDAEFVYSQAEKITNREIHAIFDVEGLLEGKEAPVDKGQEVFKKLIEENCFFVRGKEL